MSSGVCVVDLSVSRVSTLCSSAHSWRTYPFDSDALTTCRRNFDTDPTGFRKTTSVVVTE